MSLLVTSPQKRRAVARAAAAGDGRGGGGCAGGAGQGDDDDDDDNDSDNNNNDDEGDRCRGGEEGEPGAEGGGGHYLRVARGAAAQIPPGHQAEHNKVGMGHGLNE